MTFKQWSEKIKENFEQCFYISKDQRRDTGATSYIQQELVNRSGIYKDVYGSTNKFTDYQLRPNLCIAMAVAPELFTPTRAKECLMIVE